MGALSFNLTNASWGWSGNCTINFEAVYNAETNSTTITFKESSFSYYGRNSYGTSATAAITVKAADNTGSTGSATLSTYGYTNGGTKTFTATPSPTTITVQHGDADGAKSVIISATATANVYMGSSATAQAKGTGSGSVTEQTGTKDEKNVAIRIDGQTVKGTLYVGKKKGTIYIGGAKA